MSRLAMLALLGACADPDLDTVESAVNVNDFTLPQVTLAERTQIVRKYDALDPDDLVPRGMLEDAILYYDVNKAKIPKHAWFVVVDLSKYSGKDRFWMVDLADGGIEPHKVAHGDGSDPDNNGYATLFGNTDGSHMSSLGFYLTGEIYDGTHIHSMRLDGLTVDGSPNGMANTNVRSRLIVVHEASYVDDDNTSQQGRSNGCLALDPTIERHVVDTIHDGTMIYVAKSQLAAPVGRASCGDGLCDGAETNASCATDCTMPDPMDPPADDPNDPNPNTPPGDGGGCSTTGGSGLAMLGVVLAIARRRRRAG